MRDFGERFKFDHGEIVRVADSGDIASIVTAYRTPYQDFYVIRRHFDGMQFDVSESIIRRNVPVADSGNVVAFPAREWAVH